MSDGPATSQTITDPKGPGRVNSDQMSGGTLVNFRGGGFAPKPQRWVGFFVFAGLIAIAEWGTRSGWISALTLPRPSDVLDTFRPVSYTHLTLPTNREV